MFVFDLEAKSQIVRCRTTGFWSMNDAKQFVDAFRTAIQQGRSQFGHLKILIDSRDMPVQDPVVNNTFFGLDRQFMNYPEDRFAILVSSSLLKIQAQRAITMDQSKVFISDSAARTWLLAFVIGADGCGPLYRSAVSRD